MNAPLPAEKLRWTCDPQSLPFDSTEDVEPNPGVVGQRAAVEALKFGLECDAPGQNVFVRGLIGTGRMLLVRSMLEELSPQCRSKHDRCYVHNFSHPERPRLISFPAGQGRAFRRRVTELAEFIRDGLQGALSADALKARRESLERRTTREVETITKPFEEALKEADLALVSIQMGPVTQTAIFPTSEGKPVPPEEYEQLRQQGQVTEEDYKAYEARHESFRKRMEEVSEQVRAIRRRGARAVHAVIEGTVRAVLGDMARDILSESPGEEVQSFLSEVVNDVAESRLTPGAEGLEDPLRLYGVNLLLEHDPEDGCPIVVENTPTLGNLLGNIDREWTPKGPLRSDYSQIRAGSMLRADGGYLILEARDVLGEPGAWKVLLRTLRNRSLEIVPAEFQSPFWAPTIKPQPIPISIKVILIGNTRVYHMLDTYDPDFGHLFKVLSDFDSVIDRREGPHRYAGVLARIVAEEGLLAFDRSGVARLVEHGARVAARRDKVTARFARIADIAREASFLAKKERGTESLVSERDVVRAIERTKDRASLPSRRFRELLKDGTIRVQTSGSVVGQINGLAVISAGPITYGFPARITASFGAGTAGIINIEGRAQLSGSIHTKGFHILGGCLRHLIRAEHALAFSASLAFEQSYGGIDGDSASGAEICCLMSALTGIPIRQSLAITGAIDQAGHIQAIGGVNEKIEGFFDTCVDAGLTGDQGVIIPRSNTGDLMLRTDVVDACRKGRFHVYEVETVGEALEILTGIPAGEREEDGDYPDGTLFAKAVEKAEEFWLLSLQSPVYLEPGEEDEDEEPTDSKKAAKDA